MSYRSGTAALSFDCTTGAALAGAYDRDRGSASATGEREGRLSVPRTFGLVLILAVLLLAITAEPATALQTRQLQTQFTGAGSPPAPFGELAGLTTDSAGRLWASDRGRHAVDRFSAAGAYEAQNDGTGAWAESTQVFGLAFSAAAGEVFAADSAEEGHLFGLDPATAAFTGKDLALALGGRIQVAADNSPGATGGDLYVSNGTKVIRIKASDGSADDFTAGPGIGTNELTGPFTEAGALAVAPDGDFYAAATFEGKVFQFAPSGETTGVVIAEAGTPLEPLGAIQAIAVDPTSEDLLVAAGNRVFEFTSAGVYVTEIKKPAGGEFHGLEGLAVGPSGSAYLAETSSEFTKQIDVFGPLLTLPDVTTGLAEVHSVTAATVNGEVNPAGKPVTGCFFEYGPTAAYGQTAPCEPAAAGLGEGEAFEPVKADLVGLTPGTVYHYRLVAADAEGTNRESGDRTFITGPTIDATSASEVTATSARLETEVNPHGLATSYSFQYGTTTAYGSQTPLPPAPLGAGTTDVTRSAFISGLAPATTYHFRVVATNSLGTVVGPDRAFTTQPAAASSLLPDSRGWELVSPALKQGIPLEAINEEGGVIQAAADGSAITYFAKGPIVTDPAGNRAAAATSQDLSTRGATGGWSTLDISTPHQQPASPTPGRNSEYLAFSTDLSHGAVQPVGATPLSPQAGEKTPYLRLPDGSYEPLVYPGNVPFGTHFGGENIGGEEFINYVEFVTAPPDLAHALLKSPTSLVAGFENEGIRAIYEWSAGALTPVSFIPPPGGTVCGNPGAPACVFGPDAVVGAKDAQLRNTISADGSRVVFSLNSGELYLRDVPRGETIQLDAAEAGCAGCQSGGGIYQDASTDGSRVFFTSDRQLTEASTAAPGGPDLYMCQITVEAGHLACALTDLSANAVDRSEPANVLGNVIGTAADGSSVYFVADGALTEGEGAVHGDCQLLPENQGSGLCNLYRYDVATSSLRLLAVLSGADFPTWGGEIGVLRRLTSRVSPDGRYLAFMSERPLTGYDNRDAASGERDQEVFLYDGATAHLTCASCNPSGARPSGFEDPDTLGPGPLVDRPKTWSGHWLAANIPGWTSTTGTQAHYQSRYLSNSGRLFFNAADALAPADTNGTRDVYQFEPAGVGGCGTGSPGFAPVNGGCVDLISSGTSGEESAFMDASESGNDVFFLTASRLTGKDEDTALDLYDARVGGGEAAPVKPVECSGDACQQPAVPPNDATPGSLTFNGAGNLKQCPKGKKLQKGKCVKQKTKKHKKHHKKKAHRKNAKNSAKRAGSNRGGHK